MKDVNLTLMQTFYLVAKEGSYSGAARRLNISYQSAANHVRRLEQALGYQLVHSEQGMKTNVLTVRGKKLYQTLLPEFNSMLDRLSSVIEEENPVVRVGMPQAIFYYLFQDVMLAFEKAHEDAGIFVFERDISLVDMILTGTLDAFITERSINEQDVRQYLIGSYQLKLIFPSVWAAPRMHDLAQWASDKPMITFEPGHIVRSMAVRNLTFQGKPPRIKISTSGSSSVKRCVTSGLGFAVIPSWTVGNLPDGTSTVPLESWPKIPLYFGEARYLERNPYISTLRSLCLDRLRASFGCG